MARAGSLKIGFDAKRAYFNRSGLGNYSRDTIRILCELQPDNQYYLYSPKKPDGLGFTQPSSSHLVLPSGFINTTFPSAWRSSGIVKDLKRDNIQLYHGLSNELPLNIHKSGIRSVVTIHDLIFLTHPQYYKYIDRKIYRRKFSYSAAVSDIIIAVSRKTKDDIVNLLGINQEKIEVVYQGCNPVFSREADAQEKAEIRKKYGLPSEYVLCVGTIEKRKNQLSLLKAVHETHLNIPVILVGKPASYLEDIMNYVNAEKMKNVIFLHNVVTTELPAIYQMANLFVYPSLVEGFGIPVLEALFSGIPVITSRGGSMEEAGGKGAYYVDPGSIGETAQAIRSLLEDTKLRESIIQEGKEHRANFTDQAIAENLTKVYKSLF